MKVFRRDDLLVLVFCIVGGIFSVFGLDCSPDTVFMTYLMLIVGVLLGRSGM